MLSLYINYPHPRISVHKNPICKLIQLRRKENQRVLHIDNNTVEAELKKISNRELIFSSEPPLNDVWIHIDLGQVVAEDSLASQIKELIGRHYGRLNRARIKTHCLAPDHPISKDILRNNVDYAMPTMLSRLSKEAIPFRQKKIEAIINTITSRISEFNDRYRKGPSLYFYKRVLERREWHPRVGEFLNDNYSLEILYATLVAWDMNSRRARLKYFDDFKKGLLLSLTELESIENATINFDLNESEEILDFIKKAYEKLELMETKGRLVSNSKCLHFLFPKVCMPMDKTNTLQYLYGNSNETINRYLDVIQFSFEIMRHPIPFEKCLDNNWNQTIPKIIDNAIILLQGKSLKEK